MKPPIVCIVGKSDVGKTTLLEKLLKELKRRNYKVATIKHDTHGFDIDKPGKDTWRHAQAGADTVTISSPHKVAMIKKVDEEWGLDKLAELNSDADIILTEGYKRSNKPKIEVFRSEKYKELLCTPEELVAVASDVDHDIPGVPVFDLDDAEGLVDLLERKFIKNKEREK